jgi:hypothetical protein
LVNSMIIIYRYISKRFAATKKKNPLQRLNPGWSWTKKKKKEQTGNRICSWSQKIMRARKTTADADSGEVKRENGPKNFRFRQDVRNAWYFKKLTRRARLSRSFPTLLYYFILFSVIMEIELSMLARKAAICGDKFICA